MKAGLDVNETPMVLEEPLFTGGTSTRISWIPLQAPAAYEVQRSPDSGFADAVSSGWIAGSQHVFTGLTDGSRYWYRVRARTAGNSPPEGTWSATVSSTQDATAPVLTINGGEAQLITGQPEYLVVVNGVAANLATGSGAWSLLVTPLTPGANVLDIVASDSAQPDNQSSEQVRIYHATDSLDFDRDGLPDGWEFSNGLDLFDDGSQQAVNGPSGDGDFDGMENLIEYVMNRNPSQPDGPAPFALATERRPGGEDFIVLTYIRRISAPGIAVEVQFSADANLWALEPQNTEPVSEIPGPDGITETVTLRVLPAISEAAAGRRQLFRLHVTAIAAP